MTSPQTLEERLDRARLARFVGREREIEQIREAMTSGQVAVLYLHGPGGVGKSSLLDVIAKLAREHDAQVIRIDARDVERSADGIERAFRAATIDDSRRLVLLLDTWELVAHLDAWLRQTFLPTLPSDAFVVVSSRLPPAYEWTGDAAWGALLHVVGLRNFTPAESAAFLARQGVEPERFEELSELSYGHPLALSLLCVLERQAGGQAGVTAYRDRPDLVDTLLRRCLDILPEGEQRQALAIAAHVRVTTEELLREVMGLDDAGPLFRWLRGLSIMQEGPYGIFPHDLARDVIDADFRWRDRQGYVEMHSRVREPIIRRIRLLRGLEQQQAANDLLFLHRSGPVVGQIYQNQTLGQGHIEPAAPDDLPVILEMVERFEGPESASVARFWWDRPEASFIAFRGTGTEPFGFAVRLIMQEPAPEAVAIDPAVDAMWRAIEASAPLRTGEVVLCDRFAMDAVRYHAPSPGSNLAAMVSLLGWVTTSNLAWSFLALPEQNEWDQVLRYLDHHPIAPAAFSVGCRAYTMYAQDWRASPTDRWLNLMGEREIASELPSLRHPLPPTVEVLSRPDFEQAVRRGLRDLHTPAALAANPLCRSRLVSRSDVDLDPASRLRSLLLEAAEHLSASERDVKLFRALERTYLKPAASQELAAESLGLPFNTYRYHLSGAIRRIVDELWRIELES